MPTDAKAKDWIEDAKFFGMNLRQLKDTKDSGGEGSMVITTPLALELSTSLIFMDRE